MLLLMIANVKYGLVSIYYMLRRVRVRTRVRVRVRVRVYTPGLGLE